MPSVVYLVVDTNLFHECRSLDTPDFPWSDLGDFDMIELVVPDPVQSELDRQKKDTRPRVRRRAVQAVAWFREMLLSQTREHVFREHGPRVLMRVTPQTPSSEFPDLLDLTVDDDKIVAVTAALAKAAPDRDIRVLSHDTRPMAKADAIGLRFEFIPDSWVREPEVDDQEREIARLRAEIAELQATQPALAVQAVGADDQRLRLTRNALDTLAEDAVASVRAMVTDRFSSSRIEEALARIDSTEHLNLLVSPRRDVYVPPSVDALTRYREETHPAWIEDCVSYLAGLPSVINGWTAASTVTVTLNNTGYRPAENVRIRFTARGPFLVAPPRDEEYAPELADLPKVPRPPTGHFLRDGKPIAVATAIRNPFDLGLPDIGSLRRPPAVREDESWYYDPKRPEKPVESFDLQCRRFRHGAGPQPFEVLIFPQAQEVFVRGALDVEVSASNVGRLLKLTLPVEVTTTFKSPMQIIESFLTNHDPIRRAERRGPV